MGSRKSQETLDSVGLQTSLEKGAEEQEETIGEGNNSLTMTFSILQKTNVKHFLNFTVGTFIFWQFVIFKLKAKNYSPTLKLVWKKKSWKPFFTSTKLTN